MMSVELPEAMRLGDEALQRDSKGLFRFNAGMEGKSFPDYNPYTIRRCRDCDIAKGKTRLARFVPDNAVCQACKIFHQCAGDAEKSVAAIERKHYLHQMQPLLTCSSIKTISNGKTIKVGFSRDGNKHLYSDTFGRSSVLTKDDLKDLATLLENATFLDDAALTHPNSLNIQHFYYFKATLHGQEVRLNVAKQIYRRPNGQIETRYFMYSINDI